MVPSASVNPAVSPQPNDTAKNVLICEGNVQLVQLTWEKEAVLAMA